ncbi:MAG: hypothetical protein RR705_00855 [Lachnospiraceae bacterium]
MKQTHPFIIGIEGPCGAGKTTLSSKLSDLLDAPVIHMDHFFLPPDLRSESRLKEAGGNIHYERFQLEVIHNLKQTGDCKYQVFNCSVMEYGQTIYIPKSSTIVIEGVYAMHPKFGDLYDYKIFCDISKEQQKARLILRNGIEGYRQFEQKWIPMEEKYFTTFRIREACDYIQS